MTSVAGYENSFFDGVFGSDALTDWISCPPLDLFKFESIRIKDLKSEHPF